MLYSLFDVLGDTVPRDALDALLEGPQRITIPMPNSALWHSLNEATKAARLSHEVSPEVVPSVVQDTYIKEEQAEQIVSISPTAIFTPTASSRIGEIVMLSLITLGEGGPSQAEPIVLKKVMDSLKVVGLEQEARALALEAAVAAGL